MYIVSATGIDGESDVLGIWIGEAESAKFWMKVLVDIRNRGVKDILIASVDGLKGFVEAIIHHQPHRIPQSRYTQGCKNKRLVPYG